MNGPHRAAACRLARGIIIGLVASLVPPVAMGAQTAPVTAAPFVVTATRLPQAPKETAALIDVLSSDTLTHAPSLTLDDALRGSAAFSLFRRSSSLVANPTAQGVSLRGLGPSGASRTLVLLDGIPLNDPFGGWVTWSKVPRLTLAHAEIVRGGGSGVWGNAALGGTVQLFAPPPEDRGGALALEVGGLDTVRGEFSVHAPVGENSAWQLGGRRFRTQGPFQYTAGQRGPIDRRLDSEHTLAHASFTTTLRSGLQFSGGARWFDEERGNGTPQQRNRSRENAGNLRLTGELRPDLTLDVLAYAQRQHFASSFSSVDDARVSETPALDQFDVPATAWGGAVVATLGRRTLATTAVGADVRGVSGETREDFFFSDGAFLRRRVAGGDQLAGGVFISHQRVLAPELSAQLAARVDHWRNTGGRRREWTKTTGAVLRDDTLADTDGTEFSPSLGLVWTPRPGVSWRASGYRAFRVPTLNELHRPFRVGNVATEANPALRRETVTGAEAGVTLNGRVWRARVSVFENRLHDGVANVTLASTPALTQRQRRNLDAIRVRGLEAGVVWNADPRLEFALDFLLADARVQRAAVAPDLVGRRLPQVPRTTLTLRGTWRPAEHWRLDVSARAVARQFEDDENQLPLDAAATLDVALRHTLGHGHELSLACENVGNSRVETGRTTGGLISLAPGRLVRVGWVLHW